MAVETTPLVVEEDGLNYASLAHILKVLELMGCKEEYRTCVVCGYPHINIRQEVAVSGRK